ncbi:CDP-alcohol phosphatidyltransferase family protein [Methanogenium organophilum]|uniref:CDP-alcohol phosphatidyltransferase family protein n=1 Tax=Methanogenium organophilum TaxID=2199 RepID=A0A9X9T7M4_METOG|nr:CDP-alcohol phosphatidyltransferase family protein [Methanogenium organophilum]WAI01254.1 CDP-alcohol phosphatidyltransferase family protein [Methanogenium organophilum]
MNITALRPRAIKILNPLAHACAKTGITPNQLTLLAIVSGIGCAALYANRMFIAGSMMLLISGILDLIDGGVARINNKSSGFGAVFDWIADKYIDALALLGIGMSGIAVISQIISVNGFSPQILDFTIIAIAIIGSLMNTFIKPVVYAEIGYDTREDGKIADPLEGIGFFGRPETLIILIIGGIAGYIWISAIIVAVCTNLSAIQRIIYLYRTIP